MQINAAAILASQQQVQRPAAQPAVQDFAPIAFKQVPKAASVPSPPAEPKVPAATPAGTGPVRPGTHLDIKV